MKIFALILFLATYILLIALLCALLAVNLTPKKMSRIQPTIITIKRKIPAFRRGYFFVFIEIFVCLMSAKI